ncbi:DUF664 domain-containing protein [Micromonospora sp. NPDC052213]|uniref:mycothiol transferase n=1 Tax=Micromonospora sp. NPDC052213 TaxID=3155812 RepID=UPI003439CEF7
MWATADETREEIVGLYRRAIAHADTTIAAVALDEVGRVPWWGDAAVTLHRVLVHVIAETQRHAGHADIVRELIDGAAGLLPRNDNLPPRRRVMVAGLPPASGAGCPRRQQTQQLGQDGWRTGPP